MSSFADRLRDPHRPQLRLVRHSDDAPPRAPATVAGTRSAASTASRNDTSAPVPPALPGAGLARARSEREMAELHRRLVAPLSAFAGSLVRAEEVADVVQEAFVRYWRRTAGAGRLVVPRSPERFLMVLVRDVANEVLRIGARRTRALGRGEAATGSHPPLTPASALCTAPDVCAERAELARAIAEASDSLPDRLREVFTMKYDEGLTTAEIADELLIEESTVRANLARALEGLRAPLVARGHWPDWMSVGEAAAIARSGWRR